MTPAPLPEADLQAYVDDRLDGARRAAVERWLKVDTEARPMPKDLPQPIG